jgi:sodium transport system permease protein
VLGKFFLVTTVSMVTTALAILSLALTAVAGVMLLSRVGHPVAVAISVKPMSVVVLVILPLAVLFSAALMAIAVIARNYKEAQGYIGPLMILVILPAMGSFIPGVELNMKTALVPIFNLSLVSREVMAGHYPWGPLCIILASTTLYAAAALAVAVWQFRREEVLFRT